MYGKIENEKFTMAPRYKKTLIDGEVVQELITKEELKADGYKEVLMGEGSGRPGQGLKISFSYEDIGDYIIKRMNYIPVS